MSSDWAVDKWDRNFVRKLKIFSVVLHKGTNVSERSWHAKSTYLSKTSISKMSYILLQKESGHVKVCAELQLRDLILYNRIIQRWFNAKHFTISDMFCRVRNSIKSFKESLQPRSLFKSHRSFRNYMCITFLDAFSKWHNTSILSPAQWFTLNFWF